MGYTRVFPFFVCLLFWANAVVSSASSFLSDASFHPDSSQSEEALPAGKSFSPLTEEAQADGNSFSSLTDEALPAEKSFSVSRLFSDGAVLQQNAQVSVWGRADAGSKVVVKVSWSKKSFSCTVGEDGRWSVRVQTPAAGYTHHTMRLRCGHESIVLQNILIGEVWLAGGQSNMEMPMKGFFNCPVRDAGRYINARPDPDGIRMFAQKKGQSSQPQEDAEGLWLGACPETVADMSAVAYFFALKLHEMLDVPVGVLSCPYGGSRVESWIPEELLASHTDENLTEEHTASMTEWHRPYMMYNSMLYPLKGYTLRGFIWYQGCSNVGSHGNFVERMRLMVEHWRSLWGDFDARLPFYQVEIAPCDTYGGDEDYSPAALLREAQYLSAKTIPNGGIVITNDLAEPYEAWNIHPCQKRPVGERLAMMALHQTYGWKGVKCFSPVATEARHSAAGISVCIPDVKWSGFNRTRGIEGLEIRTADGVWHKLSEASFSWDTKTLEINFQGEAAEVRYGWGDFAPGNLKDCFGLPLTPFRLKLER